MPWHFVEHVPCVLWARAEHAFCTCRARAAASRPWFCPHCRAAPRTLPLTRTRQAAPRHVSGKPGASRHGRPTAPAQVGAARAFPARHLPPGASQAYPQLRLLARIAATSPLLQKDGSPSSLSPATSEPTSTAYIRTPELNRVLEQPQVILLVLPWPAVE